MKTFLFKSEPSTYSFDDLVREKRCTWDGVTSPAALLALRSCAKGDRVLFYHTGDEKRIVGEAEIVVGPRPDPKQDDERLVVVDLKPLRPVKLSVSLAEIKADKRFASFALVTQSRLSVMPVPPDLDAILRKMLGL